MLACQVAEGKISLEMAAIQAGIGGGGKGRVFSAGVWG